MIFSWAWNALTSTLASPFKACWITLTQTPLAGPTPAPKGDVPSQQQCWATLAEIHSEAEFRWMHEQHATLDKDGHKDRVFDALWTLVRFHGDNLQHIENQLRAFGYGFIWLYPLPHGDGNTNPDCPTTCRDPLTHEDRAFSVGVFLGPESKALEIKRDLAGAGAGTASLAECGFLEIK